MSIANLKSAFFDIVKSSNSRDGIAKKFESISSNFNSTPTIIAKDLRIEGNIIGNGIIEIEGNVKGVVNVNSVILREDGVIEGSVIAESLSLRGKFNGTVNAKNINITSKAHVTGLLEYSSLSVEDGAFIDGQFKKVEKISAA